MLRTGITVGSFLLIALGFLHAVHVARGPDVEPYLWGASSFMIFQGILTLTHLRRDQATT